MNLIDIATNKLHYKRIREEPYYRLECMLEEMRAEMQPSLCQDIPEETRPVVRGKMYSYLRVDRTALDLDSQIAVLRGAVVRLDKEIKKLMASASKRKPTDIKKLINIYRDLGRGGDTY